MSAKHLPLLIFTLCSFFLSSVSTGQHFNFQELTVREGLSQNQCRSLAMDSWNRLWIGTSEGGICRYDGQDVKIFEYTDGLCSNQVNDLSFDSLGYMWIATRSGLSRFDGVNFKNYLDNPATDVNQVSPSKDGRVWFVEDWERVGYILQEEITFVPTGLAKDSRDIISMHIDGKGRIWLSTFDSGLLLYRNGKFERADGGKIDGMEYCTFVDRLDGELQFVTESGGFQYQGDTLADYPLLGAIAGVKVYSALEDSSQSLWLGTNDGTLCFKPAGESPQMMVFNEKNGLKGKIYDMIKDHEGGMWFATNYGVKRLKDFTFAYFGKEQGLNDHYVSSIKAIDDLVWLATDAGLQYVDGDHVYEPSDLPNELKNNPRVIIPGDHGEIYIGSRYGIYVYDGQRYRHYKEPDSTESSEVYYCGIKRKNGDLLFGGPLGIHVFDGESLQDWPMDFGTYLPSVNSIVEDAHEGLWIATNEVGLFYQSPEGKVSQFTRPKTIPSHLSMDTITRFIPTNTINCLLVSSKGDLWIGTSGHGVQKLPNCDPSAKVVSYESQKSVSSNIYSMIEDIHGDIWLGTDRGLSRVEIIQNDDIHITNFGLKEGFRAIEVFHNSVTQDQAGRLWFGTVQGVTRIDVNKPVLPITSPVPYIKDIQLFQKDVNWNNYTDQIETWANVPSSGSLVLDSDMNTISFYFAGISFDIPQQITCRWKLEGYDQEWSVRSSKGVAIYPDLGPGAYTFRVQAYNAAGKRSLHEATYDFVITKPFYKTRIFFVMCFVVAIIMAWIYFQSRVKNLEEQQQKLQTRVRERTVELETQTEEIKRQRKNVETAKEEIEEKNSELTRVHNEQTSSLRYAKRIQEIILSSSQLLHTILPASFYMDIPRNIVSGDFIWIDEHQDDFYIALVDCTSHGVPAAFMSIIGNELFNTISQNHPGIAPDHFLGLLNEELSQVLRGGPNNGGDINDGMDVAMCKINKHTLEMTFSGAKRALLYEQDGEIKIIKGSFSSIGIDFVGVDAKFESSVVQLTEDSMVYLSSDGFYTQFGGRNSKRYKMANFRKFLHQIHHLPMEVQRSELAKEFRNWTDESKQMDDVLVVGFKLKGMRSVTQSAS